MMKTRYKSDKWLTNPAARAPLVRIIIVSGGLLLLAVLAINIWSLRESWLRTVHNTEDTAVNLSLSQARQAEDTFLQTEITLRELQRDVLDEISAGVKGERLSKTMRDLQSRLPQLHGLFYYDANGKWIATSAAQIPTNINNSDREYFSYHRNNARNSVHIGAVIRSRSTGDLVIPVSMRISGTTGGFDGVLLATIKVDYFRRFYSYYEMGLNDVLVLMLEDSTVLYARPMSDGFIGKNLSASPLFREMLLQADRGSGQWSAALDGKSRIFGFARSDRYPVVVAAGYDKQSLFTDWVKSRIQEVTLNIALLTGILLLGYLILRQAKLNLRIQSDLALVRDELTQANNSLKSMAMIDGLTGLANRRQFDLFLEASMAEAVESGAPLSLIMIDVDYFKRYNDTCGHVSGDACLQRIADVLRDISRRAGDKVARYGGEEFAVILPGTDLSDALAIATRAVQAVSKQRMPHPSTDIAEGIVTISVGCASFTAGMEDTRAQSLTTRADEALYRAKREGKNRACPAPP